MSCILTSEFAISGESVSQSMVSSPFTCTTVLLASFFEELESSPAFRVVFSTLEYRVDLPFSFTRFTACFSVVYRLVFSGRRALPVFSAHFVETMGRILFFSKAWINVRVVGAMPSRTLLMDSLEMSDQSFAVLSGWVSIAAARLHSTVGNVVYESTTDS